jgi:glycosyltransferase involved in cell wall biosynthesis
MNKRLLLIAFHFPPLQGSTGIHRTLAFSRYLKDQGWEVCVLTAHPRAYPEARDENLDLVAKHVTVVRAPAFDAQRHLSIFGRYPGFLSLPDRWQSWIVGGVFAGFGIVRRWRPSAIMSTYPLASAHCIGRHLHRLTGVPWVADFRDPMAQDNYPTDQRTRRSFIRIEQDVFRFAARVVTTTAGTAHLYAKRFPNYAATRIHVVPNGFDEEMFAGVAVGQTAPANAPDRKLILLHSGLLYPHERNPSAFFDAIAALLREGAITPAEVEFRFQGSGHEQQFQPRLEELRITDVVKLLPAVPYQAALAQMCNADACMILQGATCNQQIPAKIYEYLYAGKPILALTDAAGDTAGLLRDMGANDIVPLDDAQAIRNFLPGFLQRLRRAAVAVPDRDRVMGLSRRASTRTLAHILEQVVQGAP